MMTFVECFVLALAALFASGMAAEYHARNGLLDREKACIRSSYSGFIWGSIGTLVVALIYAGVVRL